MITTEKGQSLIEVVFSIGLMVLIITGVISLMIKTINVKTAANQRERASEMAEVVIENLLEQKTNDRNNFWLLTDVNTPQTITGYDDYLYTTDFEQVIGNGCSDSVVECLNATITIFWGNNQTLSVKRFFSKKM